MLLARVFLPILLFSVVVNARIIPYMLCNKVNCSKAEDYNIIASSKEISEKYTSVSDASYEKLKTIKECSDVIDRAKRVKRVSRVPDSNDLIASLAHVAERVRSLIEIDSEVEVTQISFGKWIDCIHQSANSSLCIKEKNALEPEQFKFLEEYGDGEETFNENSVNECKEIPHKQLAVLKILLNDKKRFHEETKEFRDKWTGPINIRAIGNTFYQEWKSIGTCADALNSRRKRQTLYDWIEGNDNYIAYQLKQSHQDLKKLETTGTKRLTNEVKAFERFATCLEKCKLRACESFYNEYVQIATSVE